MRILEGVVTSDKMQKTRVIMIERIKQHPRYLKYYKTNAKYKAHDEKNEYKVGDKVRIKEVHPLSKDKRWVIIGKI